ncbi:MAG TPA: hypothetical protein VIL13_01995 [Longimicrobiales bacterium]
MTVAELRALLEGVPPEWAGAPVLAVGREEYVVSAVDGIEVQGRAGTERYLVFRIARELESGGGDRPQPLQPKEANHAHTGNDLPAS